MLPVILGLEGPRLSDSERGFIREADPAGFILFGRNVETPDQLRRLTADLREASGRDSLPILVDQEGGRVVRLAPPAWPRFPSPSAFGALYARAPISAIEAARLNARAMAEILREAGITLNAFPLLDLCHEGADPVIGDRAFAADPLWVSALGSASIQGLTAGGIGSVIKHLPGHGRAAVDSHREMPVVRAEAAAMAADLAPFQACRTAMFGMVAHLLFQAWDAEHPASQSPRLIDFIRTELGFEGLLMSDDVVMDALHGPVEVRAAGVLEAGCDLALVGRCDAGQRGDLAAALPTVPEALALRLAQVMEDFAAGAAPAELGDLIEQRDALLALA